MTSGALYWLTRLDHVRSLAHGALVVAILLLAFAFIGSAIMWMNCEMDGHKASDTAKRGRNVAKQHMPTTGAFLQKWIKEHKAAWRAMSPRCQSVEIWFGPGRKKVRRRP